MSTTLAVAVASVVWGALSAPQARLEMQELVPLIQEFPQSQQLLSKLLAFTLEIDAGTGIQARFEAVCASSDDASIFAALLQADLRYQASRAGKSNQDVTALLDQAKVAPSGDRLDATLELTDDQVVSLIQSNTFEPNVSSPGSGGASCTAVILRRCVFLFPVQPLLIPCCDLRGKPRTISAKVPILRKIVRLYGWLRSPDGTRRWSIVYCCEIIVNVAALSAAQGAGIFSVRVETWLPSKDITARLQQMAMRTSRIS